MKKLLFLLLSTVSMYGQAIFDEGIQVTGNTATAETSRLGAFQLDGTLNYLNATDLPISTATQTALNSLDANNVKLTGSQTITSRKGFISNNSSAGGISISNSRTTQTFFGENYGLIIQNTGTLGALVQTDGAGGTALGVETLNSSSGLNVTTFSSGTGVSLRRTGSSTGALLTAEVDQLVIGNGGKLTTKQNIVSTGYEVTGRSDTSVVLAGGGTALLTDLPVSTATQTAIGINSTATVYVATNGNNSTAELGNQRKPFLTIDSALDALPATGGVVNIGVGTFASPTKAKIKDNTVFKGSGRPYPNMTTTYTDAVSQPTRTSPTKLVGGTILQGTFDFSTKNNIEVRNLGVDVGKEWIDANNGGAPLDGLITANDFSHPDNNTTPPTKGVVIDNVSSLNYSASALPHAILVENTVDATVNNVLTVYGNHGLVVKSIGTNVSNVQAYGHGGEGVIIKADTYAYCSDVNVSNVYISSIGAYDGGGFMVDAGSGKIERINISNVNVEFTSYGFTTTANGNIEDLKLSNVNVNDVNGIGIKIRSSVMGSSLVNCTVNKTTLANGFEVFNEIIGYAQVLTNCKASNCDYNGFFLRADYGAVVVNNLTADNNSTSGTLIGNVYGVNLYFDTPKIGRLAFESDDFTGKTFTLNNGASDALGSGSIINLANGLSGSSYRAMVVQLNSAGGLTIWKFDGSTWVDTGARINTDGTYTAQGFKTPTGTNTKFLLDGGGTVLAKDIDFSGLSTYTNNADAISGGLAVGKLYQTSSGDVKIVH